MSRDSDFVGAMYGIIIDALPLWEDKISAIGNVLARQKTHTGYERVVRRRRDYWQILDPVKYVALLPDGTRETMSALGFRSRGYWGEYPEIEVTWDELPLLEEGSQIAELIHVTAEQLSDLSMDEIKHKTPELLEFFDDVYESWQVTYRCTQALLGSALAL